jgi:Zn-dependent protease
MKAETSSMRSPEWISRSAGTRGLVTILSLAGFNLLPGYPLDGGRVLRALIWWKTGNADRSTQLAAMAGQLAAFLFIALGIFQYFGGAGIGGLWIALSAGSC